MKRTIKRARLLVVAVVSACALMAVSASAASATYSYWANPGPATASGTLTLKLNGANEKSCTVSSTLGETNNNEFLGFPYGTLYAYSEGTYPYEATKFSCVGGSQLWLALVGYPRDETGFLLDFEPKTVIDPGPYENYTQVKFTLPWTNPVEGKGSSFSFSNTKIGTTEKGGTMTATGTITVKNRTTGALFTLKH